jgi:signal transduction histidine kinase
VKREVRQRELIQIQEQELEVINKQQENLLHFISHEIKGYLTKSEAGFAGITEGDYGVISTQLKSMATAALADVRKGVATVMDILDASNLKKGTVTFKKAVFDFRTAVQTIVTEQQITAHAKNLELDVEIAEGKYQMQGDEEKIREHVIRNLIDNAIRYTQAGAIHVQLSDGDGKIHFSVKDSGVGITPEDMANLFTEGGHGKDSIKINVHSTGYGLFIAKQVVEASGGKIWAESEGGGKGSRFVVELPASV